MKHAVIVGGGIVGGAAAFELLDRGWTVTIVEKGEWGSGRLGRGRRHAVPVC